MTYRIEAYISEFDFLDGKEPIIIIFKSRSEYDRLSELHKVIADLYIVYEEET